MEHYWNICVQLISILKEDAMANHISMVVMEEKFEEKNNLPCNDAKDKVPTLSQTHVVEPNLSHSREWCKLRKTTLYAISQPPLFELLHIFITHMEVEYGGFIRS